MQDVMLRPYRPMSNLERQRAFCARNPGYYCRLKAKRRVPDGQNWMTVAAELLAKQAASLAAAPAPAEAVPLPHPSEAALTAPRGVESRTVGTAHHCLTAVGDARPT